MFIQARILINHPEFLLTKTDVWGTIRSGSSKIWSKEHLISSGVFSGDIRTLILAALALISDVTLSKYFHLFRLNNIPWRKAGNNFIRTSKPAKIILKSIYFFPLAMTIEGALKCLLRTWGRRTFKSWNEQLSTTLSQQAWHNMHKHLKEVYLMLKY